MQIKQKILEKKILESILNDHGFLYLSNNFDLTKEFIELKADMIDDDVIWRNILMTQRHINPKFFNKFSSEMSKDVKVLLSYRQSTYDLAKLLRKLEKRGV